MTDHMAGVLKAIDLHQEQTVEIARRVRSTQRSPSLLSGNLVAQENISLSVSVGRRNMVESEGMLGSVRCEFQFQLLSELTCNIRTPGSSSTYHDLTELKVTL